MKKFAALSCLLLLFVLAADIAAPQQHPSIDVVIRYQSLSTFTWDAGPQTGPLCVVPEGYVSLAAPLTRRFRTLSGEQECLFAFWTVDENVYTEREFHYTAPKSGKFVATAWYDCGNDCFLPHCRSMEGGRILSLLMVRGIVFGKGQSLPRTLPVIEMIEPTSLEPCEENPCSIVMDIEGKELTSVTAASSLEVNREFGDEIWKVEYSFREWLYRGAMQGAGVRTLEISPSDRAFSQRAYAFYSQYTMGGVWVDDETNIDIDAFMYPPEGPVDISPFCKFVFGREQCPHCSGGPDEMCDYDFTFTNLPHHRVQILNKNTGDSLAVLQSMVADTLRVSLDAADLRSAGGLENLTLRFIPRPGRRDLSGSLWNVRVDWKER